MDDAITERNKVLGFIGTFATLLYYMNTLDVTVTKVHPLPLQRLNVMTVAVAEDGVVTAVNLMSYFLSHMSKNLLSGRVS